MRKRVLSILLSACMVLTLLPAVAQPAMAADGGFTVTGGTLGTDYTYTGSVLTVFTGTAITIANTTPTTPTTDRIVVNSGATANITLSSVNIDVSGTNNACAFDMAGATVNLTLLGTNVLKSGEEAAGLRVPAGPPTASLTITGDGTGSLEATTNAGTAVKTSGAGIGGNTDEACGNVTINGGTITATGGLSSNGSSGAGIGGGGRGSAGGTVHITGGFVRATGALNSAGIGGGGVGSPGGAGGTVEISGGTVIATGGGWGGAGIGGGRSADGGAGGTITITGGNVTAIGGYENNAAGIGGGGNAGGGSVGAAATIKISRDATVVAVSSGTTPAIHDDDGIIAPDSGTAANILVANYQSNVAPGTTTEVKSADSNALTPAVSFEPQGEYKFIAFTVPTVTNYTLYTGNVNQKGTRSGATSSTFAVAAGLNVFTDVTADTYTATVAVQTDGSPWISGQPTIKLSSSPDSLENEISGAFSGGSYTFSNLAGAATYYVWEDAATDTYTGQIVTKGSSSATVNYYTVTYMNDDGTELLNTQTVLSGKTAVYGGPTLAKESTAQYSYAFSKWVTEEGGNEEATLTNITVAKTVYASFTPTLRSYTITWMDALTTIGASNVNYGTTPTPADPAKAGYTFNGWSPPIAMVTEAATYEATWTPVTYTITYTFNGADVLPANPTSYTIESDNILLTNPSRSGHSFEGWSGTGLSGNTDPVTIWTGSTGDRTYTANWKANTPGAGPTISGMPTSGSITVNTAAGNEYYISTNATAPATWPDSGDDYFKETGPAGTKTFSGLTPATRYYIHVRVAETADSMPSDSVCTPQYTLPATPAAGTDYTISYTAETITFASTYEVNTSTGFGSDTAVESNVTLLIPGTPYYVRVKAVEGGAPASAADSFTIPLRPEKPTAITADKTKNSITITTVTGQEYKISGGGDEWQWQDSGSFTDLSADTGYTVYARVKAVNSGSVSFVSEACSATIRTKADGNAVFVLPTISVSPTYGTTLADIPLLLSGWSWSVPATVPTVTNSGYSAVYTPADTATVDYSGVEGYSTETGKVTRTIPLTVNRATPTAADFTYTAPAALDYSGTAKSATVAVKDGIFGMGTFTVRYYPGGTETAPTNAGTYTVKIDIVQGSNYEAASNVTGDWTFTIAKVAQAPLSITDKPITVTYGDTFTLSTTGGSGTGGVTWAVEPGGSATVDENTGAVTITGVGETTITATREADGNYLADVTDTYTFTPEQLLLTVATPSADGGWTKTYDGGTAFETAITVGSITNKVGADEMTVSAASATYDTAAVGSGDKTLTITYAIDGEDSGNYSAPANTVVSTASITAAAPTIALVPKTAVHTGSMIEIAAATVTGVAAEGDITADYAGAISYTYYTAAACADSDKTTVDRSGADALGGAPKNAGTYYVKAAIDASGNYAMATSVAVTLTIYHPSSGGGSAPTSTGAPVIVDGKTQNIGTEKKSGDTTTVTVDQSKLGENIGGAAAGSSVVVPVNGNGAATASLVVKNIEDMAAKNMTLTVQTGNVAYNLNTSAIDTAALTAAFPGADMSAVPFDVTITNSSVTVEGETLVVPPVAFTVTATYSGQTVSVDTFSAYIDRVIEVTAEQAAKITTAVVVNADGSIRHVPTNVMQRDGKWYAIVSSRTNSTYALIQNEVTFADAKGKWYEAAVNEMGSRKIIGGRSASVFDGDAGITRAEFSAILVRALGLPADGTSTFSDVPAGEWYAGAAATAAQYGIVAGKGDNHFEPDAAITRQEAMLMLQRAAALTKFTGASSTLDSFADTGSIDIWAKDAAKWSVGSGLFQGTDGMLNPTAGITRAESATIILRLLQKAGLVDVRDET